MRRQPQAAKGRSARRLGRAGNPITGALAGNLSVQPGPSPGPQPCSSAAVSATESLGFGTRGWGLREALRQGRRHRVPGALLPPTSYTPQKPQASEKSLDHRIALDSLGPRRFIGFPSWWSLSMFDPIRSTVLDLAITDFGIGVLPGTETQPMSTAFWDTQIEPDSMRTGVRLVPIRLFCALWDALPSQIQCALGVRLFQSDCSLRSGMRFLARFNALWGCASFPLRLYVRSGMRFQARSSALWGCAFRSASGWYSLRAWFRLSLESLPPGVSVGLLI